MKIRALALFLILVFPGLVHHCLAADAKKDDAAKSGANVAGSETPQRTRGPKTGRALLEEAVLLTASTLDYWGAYGKFTVDWEFTWKTFGRKFFTAQSPRLDSNAFWFNWSHAAAGAGYYNMARTNGLNSRLSTVFSFVSSSLWETFSEWRELISINDMIFSPFGGPAIGEPLYQVSSYFSHRSGILNKLASFLFNPFLAANNWFDQGSGPDTNSAPDLDWHRFRLTASFKEDKVSPAGTTAVAQSGAYYRQFNVGLDTETISVPGYGKAQAFRQYLSDTLSSRVSINMSFSASGMEEFRIRTSAVLVGYAWQSARQDDDGSARGLSSSLGFGTAFEVYKKRAVVWYDSNDELQGGALATVGDARFIRPTPTQFTDKLGVISPLGAVFKLSRFTPGLHIRWTTEAYGDFGMVNALAYNRFTESHDPSGVKSTLLNWGYYYGLGMTLVSDLAVDIGQWRLLAAASYQWYDSIQGLDRYQYLGYVTDDFKIRDSRLLWRCRLAYHLRRTPIELGLAAEGIDRRGRLLDIAERYWETNVFYQIGIVF